MGNGEHLTALVGTAEVEADAQWVSAVLIEDRETPCAVRDLGGQWGIFVAPAEGEELAPIMQYTAGALAAVARLRRGGRGASK